MAKGKGKKKADKAGGIFDGAVVRRLMQAATRDLISEKRFRKFFVEKVGGLVNKLPDPIATPDDKKEFTDEIAPRVAARVAAVVNDWLSPFLGD